MCVAPAVAQAPDFSLQALRRLQGGPGTDQPAVMAERRRLLDEGEAALAAGDTEAAQQAFDRAALLVHAADTEMALVRAYMQAGEYRRALAFGAHAAGAHRELPAATVLYAWLLQAGGQGLVAGRMLDQALAASPTDATLLAARSALSAPTPRTESTALASSLRPYATGASGPRPGLAVHTAGTAVLAAGGGQALVPSGVLNGAREIWLRNGLGQTVLATVRSRDEVTGVAVLALALPLPLPPDLRLAPAPLWAGSPGSLVEHADGPTDSAAWPWLRLGFFGRLPVAGADPRPLGIDAPPGPRGGPVFDAAGRLAGMALPGRQGQPDRLLEGAAFVAVWGVRPANATVSNDPPLRVSPDAVYETGLRVALQVLVSR